MSDVKICRICLSSDVKMYSYHKYELKKFYDQVMAIKMNNKDGLPHHFCYECAALLGKFHKFKEKCRRGHEVLKELLLKGPITLQSISEVDRNSTNLQSSIELITVRPDRVKTYVIKSHIEKKLHRINSIEAIDIGKLSDHEYDPIKFEAKDEPEEELEAKKEQNIVLDGVPESVGNMESMYVTEDIEDFASEDDKLLIDFKVDSIDVKSKGTKRKKNKITSNKKRKKIDKEEKTKRFEVTDKKKSDLDPNNWLKFNLTEEEAVEEFKARGQHRRYLSAEFKCTDCLRGFSKQDMLNRHVKLRHDESVGPIECRFCRMRFKWKCFLNKHMRQHYTKYKCLRCDLVCPLETTAMFHEEYHNGVIRKCKHCGEEFKHLTTYYTHLRTHRSEHVCTLCGASFVSPIGLGIHKKIKHVDPVKEVAHGEDEYCVRCDIRFETRKAFEEHLIHSAKHVDGLDDLDVQLSTPSNPRKRRQTLKRHTRIPTDCHLCGKHFATQAACRKHHLAEHPRTSFFAPNERHICEVCGISLAPGSVTSHLNIHTREKIYSCKTCGRQFNSKGGMMTHQLTHTSERPVACTLCDKRFKQISSMKLHYRTFHLKEPYPKRNRKKKQDGMSKLDDYVHEESDENLPLDRWR